EVLMPQEVIDDDEVALLPAIVIALVGGDAHEAVAVAFHYVEPGLAGMAVQRLRLARRELDHDLRQSRGLVADRAVVEELGSRSAGCGQALLLVVGGMDPARA